MMKKVLFILFCLLVVSNVYAETVTMDSGRVINGQIIEVTDDYIRMLSNDEIIKLRFRNMDIDSAEKYRDYVPKPYQGPTKIEREAGPVIKTYRDYIREGLAFAQEKKFQEAIGSFNEAIDIRNDVWDIYLFRAGVYQAMGNYDKAIEDYTTVITRKPNDPETYSRRGWVYETQGKAQKAIDDYSKVLEFDPENSDILMERYKLYQKTKQWWNAKGDIDYIISLNPDEGEPYIDQALLNYRIGSYYNAWKSVYEAGKRKVKVPSDFIDALREKLPDPFLRKKEEKKPSLGKIVKGIVFKYLVFIIIAVVAGILAMIVFLIPAKENPPVDPLKEAIEKEEDVMFRTVTFKRAPFVKRFCAGIIDLIVLSIVSWAVQLMTKIDVFAVVLAALFLVRDSFGGVSPGKSMVGLRVIDDHGYRGVFLQGFIRNFTFALPLVVFYVFLWSSGFQLKLQGQIALLVVFLFFLLEAGFILFSKKVGRRIGDRMAGTFVHDLHPEWWRWPFIVISILLTFGYLIGTVTLDMTFDKAFLYRLNPLRYYDIGREFSFSRLKGWKITSEGEGGLVLENPKIEGSMVLAFNEDVKDYSLDLCVSAFTQSMQAAGLDMRTNEKNTIAGRPAYKVGFMEKKTDSGILIVYFKRDDWGELYVLQVTSPRKNMRYVMADATSLIESFRFE